MLALALAMSVPDPGSLVSTRRTEGNERPAVGGRSRCVAVGYGLLRIPDDPDHDSCVIPITIPG